MSPKLTGAEGWAIKPPMIRTSLPEQGLFQVPWGKGWAVAYGLELANEQIWALVTAQPLTGCMTLPGPLSLSEPQFLICKEGKLVASA